MSNNTKTDSKKDFQVKNLVFTWNNYQETPEYEKLIETFAKENCTFLCYSKETAPTTGTPHLQGYISLEKKKRPTTINNYFHNKIHTEPARKCKLANYRYVTKEGKAWVWDSLSKFCGEIDKKNQPEILNKSKKEKSERGQAYKHCVQLAKQGKMETILTQYPLIYLQYKDKLNAIRLDTTKCERMYLNNEYGKFFKCHFLWLYGATGLGKSFFCTIIVHLLNAFYAALYPKLNKNYTPLRVHYKNKNKWWDRYDNEEIVIIEEASPETMKTSAHYYKQWIDEYPFNPEIKGSTINYIRPKFIIITSNYSLQQCFTDPTTGSIKLEDYNPLSRRLCEYHLTERKTPNWPNFNDLAKYECTLNIVKTNYNTYIDNLILNSNIGKSINDNKQYIEENNKRKLETESSTSEEPNKKVKPFTEEEIIVIENNTELNAIKEAERDPESSEITNDNSETTDDDKKSETGETSTITIMVMDTITETEEDYHCIKCKKKSTGLFCEDCSKVQIAYENHAMCNECHRFFTALIDSHCPECTIKLKEEYKKSKETKSIDETRLTPENAIPVKTPETPEKPKPSSWIEWEDTIISCNLYNIQSQVNWLYDNIFIDTKNFYFFQKNHNTIPSLLMIRMAIKLKMSKVMTIQKQYENKVGMDGKKSTLINFLKLDEETLKKRNSTYKNIIMQQKTLYSKLNRCLFTNGKKLLTLDDNLKLAAFRNIYDVSDYLIKNGHKTISINYLDKEILNDLLKNNV